MAMTYLTALEALAKAAPSGEWRFVPWHIAEGPPQVRVRTATEDYLLCELPSDNAAAYIAAAHPAAVLDLIARVRKAEEWQPIETAPIEQHVLVYGEKIAWRGPTFGYLHKDYNGHGEMWTLDGRCGPTCSSLTHWRPLPTAPSKE